MVRRYRRGRGDDEVNVVGSSGSAGPSSGAIMPVTPPLCVRPPSRPRTALMCGTRLGLTSWVPSATLDENGMCTCASLRFRLFALFDDLVLAIGSGLERRCGYRRRVYPLIVIEVRRVRRDRARNVDGGGLREVVLLAIAGAALGVTSPTGSSSVLPPLWTLSDSANKER